MNRLKTIALPACVAILMLVNVVVLTKFSDTSQKLVEQQSMSIKIKDELRGTSQRLETVSEEKTTIESSLKEERLKTDSLNAENESLKANLQAKKEARLASMTGKGQETAPAPTVQVSGDKHTWLAASGIPEAHWGYVDSIVSRESGWNPNAVNKSSGACGLGQQLPCGKWAGAWNDPVAALKAMTGYVNGRYGGWPQAVAFWNANHWY